MLLLAPALDILLSVAFFTFALQWEYPRNAIPATASRTKITVIAVNPGDSPSSLSSLSLPEPDFEHVFVVQQLSGHGIR
jgi:hypothetical protein